MISLQSEGEEYWTLGHGSVCSRRSCHHVIPMTTIPPRRCAQELADARTLIEAAIQQPDKALVFLRPGRLVRVREGAVDWGWGIVCSVSRRPGSNGAADGAAAPASHYMLDTLLATAAGSMKGALRGASCCWFKDPHTLCAYLSP